MSATKTASKKPVPPATPASAAPSPAVTKPAAKASATAQRKKAPSKTLPSSTTHAADPSTSASKPAPAAKPAKEPKPKKLAKVRDSFTMPEDEYGLLDTLKTRGLKAGRATKKSEVLRAGLQLLAKLSEADLVKALNALPHIKVGRPKK